MHISEENVWHYIIAGFAAGVVGAMLAIGGALILIPVWLKVGVDKDVAASSTAPLILTGALVALTTALFNGYYSEISTMGMLFYLLLAFLSAAVVKGTHLFIYTRLFGVFISQISAKSFSSLIAIHRRDYISSNHGALPVFKNGP